MLTIRTYCINYSKYTTGKLLLCRVVFNSANSIQNRIVNSELLQVTQSQTLLSIVLTCNQISLIDTRIRDIPDFTTPLPATTFMLTFNSENQKHSLWRTIDQGANTPPISL
jgi:hypothetical protein